MLIGQQYRRERRWVSISVPLLLILTLAGNQRHIMDTIKALLPQIIPRDIKGTIILFPLLATDDHDDDDDVEVLSCASLKSI